MNIHHIDNGHYRLTASQAKSLMSDGKLPRIGYEKPADKTKLAAVALHNHKGEKVGTGTKAREAWISQTPVYNWRKQRTEQVWAIFFVWDFLCESRD